MTLPPLPGAPARRPFVLVGTNYTHDERERTTYMAGTGRAALYAELADVALLEESVSDARTHIQEACGSIPGEDFMQELIDHCMALSKGRVTKHDVIALAERLEALQTEIAQSAEYGRDELRKATDALAL